MFQVSDSLDTEILGNFPKEHSDIRHCEADILKRMLWKAEKKKWYRDDEGNQVSRLCNYSEFELLLPLYWKFDSTGLKNCVPGAA